MTEADPLLSVRNLEKHYPITEGLLRREVGTVRAVDGVSFDVQLGEAFGLVGESGCGKSTTALSVLRLEEPTGGDVRFDGDDVRAYDDDELRRFRRRAQLVLQDPDSALNPRRTVGESVEEPLRIHGLHGSQRRRHVVEDTLERVGLSAAAADQYPHEFSGGEKQRIAIARALVLNPDLIVADEPVSALDGRTKADVLELLGRLQREFDVAIVFISHDVDLVRRFCDRAAVMYLGEIVESGAVDKVFDEPRHPYTQLLVSSIPSLDPSAPHVGVEPLTDDLPDASDPPSGCRFHPRCPAIIPPADTTIPRDQWRGLVRFRFRLENDWTTADDVRAAVAGRESDDPATIGSVPATDDAVRSTFDLPAKLADPDLEAALTTAVESIEEGDLETARAHLAAPIETVCERESPTLETRTEGRPVACHRYDPSVPGEPETDLETTTTR
ncbi:ABC transporter ATP-binding protein [Natronosalvus rutilus]|uniref:ATP-binding cassette domain-containing protein n=1 Tax=Natronosalvus rutilus TaxID=2953753 RepID=A0A9E7SUJ7_9EURY|nr:oligopeptide/dipeptide ABC transporter ATP-binding protein [Natronosalvus rutilus]UTF52947.1 ATP-binding cassette domain-containing protein [Natronosalvus rutilus]